MLVAINLTHNKEFEQKSFDEQLATLAFSTMRSYKEARKRHTDAFVIVAWREYGLSNQQIVAQDNIHKFKNLLADLTSKRELLIIAGSLVSQKKIVVKDKQEKLDHITAAYDQYQFVNTLEKLTHNSLLFFNYREQFALAKAQDYFNNFKNTCYFFKQGEQVYRRHKIAPCKEIPQNADQQPSAYTFKEQDFLFTLDNLPDFTIGIEICLEHSLGVLHHLVKDNTLEAPTLHLIIADSNVMVPEYACGDYTVRIDSDSNDSINFGRKPNARDDFFYVYQYDPYQDRNPILKEVNPDIYDYPEEVTQFIL